MHCWMLWDLVTGNALGWSDDRDKAMRWLIQTVREDPEHPDDYALDESDEDGNFVGEPIFGSAVLEQALASDSGGGG